MRHRPAQDVFALSEVARAAGVPAGAIGLALRATGVTVLPGGFLTFRDAVALGRAARSASVAPPCEDEPVTRRDHLLFAPTYGTKREPAAPAAVSMAAHGLAFGLVVLATSAGMGPVAANSVPALREPMRLVFLRHPRTWRWWRRRWRQTGARPAEGHASWLDVSEQPAPRTQAARADSRRPAEARTPASAEGGRGRAGPGRDRRGGRARPRGRVG